MLYIISTPIGNLKDITYRAVETLNSVDYILCEDTRVSSVLLKHYNINKPLYSYHKFNEKASLQKVINDLENGLNIALISDAGTPTISDPGLELVKTVIENQLPHTALPGAVAFVNALVISGFSAPFSFIGFLPAKSSDKKEMLKELKESKKTLVFYTTPHAITKDINDLHQVFGNREIAVAREMTKKFEEVVFSTLAEGYSGVKKGEFVLIVAGANNNDNPLNMLEVEEHLDFYMNLGYAKSDAIEMVAKDRGMRKNEVYKHSFDKPVLK